MRSLYCKYTGHLMLHDTSCIRIWCDARLDCDSATFCNYYRDSIINKVAGLNESMLQARTSPRRSSWALKIRRTLSHATTLPSSTTWSRPQEASRSRETSRANTRRTSPTSTNSWMTRCSLFYCSPAQNCTLSHYTAKKKTDPVMCLFFIFRRIKLTSSYYQS